MKFLIIGLGSMGKRRIRNLQYLQYSKIVGFDLRKDRREDVEKKYSIETIDTLDKIKDLKFTALIISVPPDKHHIYMQIAIKYNIPCFVEASVVDYDFEELINSSKNKNVFIAPSSTMYFHPAIKKIQFVIESNLIGAPTTISYHSGQYLPDWHTYENVKDFYVSQKETGGAREIVPFELTWITKIFGYPVSVSGFVKKTIEIEGAELIDDTYISILDYNNFILMLTIDVTSRVATRRLLINGSDGQVTWDWNDNFINVYTTGKGWHKLDFQMLEAENGYNKNITEQMYIDELSCFIENIENHEGYVNSLEKDHKVLKILYAIEESSNSKKNIFI
jgi:predicted dehydrogenase